MRVLAVVPARGGSTRLPGKNLLQLGGRTLVARAVESGLAAHAVDHVLVSTDDEDIAAEGRRAGADVPFLRPAELASDTATDHDVLRHALGWMRLEGGAHPEVVVLLRPTTPFKTGALVDEVVARLDEGDVDVVRTVTRVRGPGHPYWMLAVGEDGLAQPFVDGVDIARYHQSQTLPPAYRLNGVVDAMRAEVVDDERYLTGRPTGTVEVDEVTGLDVDTELDFRICQLVESEAGP